MVEEYSDKELKETLDRVYDWCVEFSKSKYFESLTEEQKEKSEFVIMSFAEYMYSYFGLRPEEWDADGLEECCLDILPRKVSASESYYRAIAPVLIAFFSFLGEKKLLRRTLPLIRRLEEIGEEIVTIANNPANWGMAKRFVMSAMDAGVDISNQEEMDKFMAFHNLQQFLSSGRNEETVPQPISKKPKIGRNDPCPCGSGKKYKKCCGKRR